MDVFISYASEDRERARQLAVALEGRGWSVWWDRKIVVGQAFDRVIEQELETAKCVVVLWSKSSVSSEWVKNEAAVAAERGVLVPASIEAVRLPLEFRRKQTADLIGWDGDPSHVGFAALCDGVAAKANAGGAQHPPLAPPGRGFRLPRRWILGGALVIAITIAALIAMEAGVFDRRAGESAAINAQQSESTTRSPPVAELERRLRDAGIELSTGSADDAARVRSYFTGPTSAYQLLAVTSLEVLGDRRLKRTGYLDMMDKWYTSLVGEDDYARGGRLDPEQLKVAMVRAHNEYHGESAGSFEEIVEPRR